MVERIIENDELISMPNEMLLQLTKGHGVIAYMHDGRMKEFRVKDLSGSDINTAFFLDYTGIKVFRQAIKKIGILV